MKAVLISIRPKWVELIVAGKKTVELRKTKPSIEPPFRCYMYMSKYHWAFDLLRKYGMEDLAERLMFETGKVVGEFTCDQIEQIAVAFDGGSGPLKAIGGNEVWYGGAVQIFTCLTTEEICKYIGGIGGVGYGWHISDLKIYEEPVELGDCQRFVDRPGAYGVFSIERAPQSWCYMEEKK